MLVTPIDRTNLGASFVSARYVLLVPPRQMVYSYSKYYFAMGADNLAADTGLGSIYRRRTS